MKYYIITYGCQMNKADSERIAAVLEKSGYKQAQKEEKTDLIVVNMCSVRQSAVDRIFGLSQKIAELKEKKPNLKTILTGCVLKKDKEKFKKKFDFILNINDLPNLPKIIKKKPYNISSHGKLSRNRLSALIPISSGCNNFCTYCVVPFTRGRLICRNHQEILKEVKNLVKNGAKEIWLLGQNVNRYRSISKTSPSYQNLVWGQENQKSKIINFANLLKMVNDIPGDFWLRFTSPNPADFSDELIEIMAKCRKITPYLNLPVQSGDDEILKRMNRSYSVKNYKNLVKKIRAAFKKYRTGLEKNITLSTDVIVGFPGETKQQFENTVKLFEGIDYDMAYIAKYSPRPQTATLKLKDNVSPKEKEKRWEILTDILKKTALKKNKKFTEKTIEILVEESKNGFLFGKSRHYKTVKIPVERFRHSDELGKMSRKVNLIGKIVKVKIINALPWGLKGKIQKN